MSNYVMHTEQYLFRILLLSFYIYIYLIACMAVDTYNEFKSSGILTGYNSMYVRHRNFKYIV